MKRPLFDVGIAVLLGSAVVLYGNIYCYLLLPVLLAAAMFCAGRAADPRWRKAAVCALSAAASILLMLSVSLSLESELKPLDGKDRRGDRRCHQRRKAEICMKHTALYPPKQGVRNISNSRFGTHCPMSWKQGTVSAVQPV